jgi:hypothetical protein
VAKHLVENYGFKRFAFADEIKRSYYAASGHSEEQFKSARGTPLEEEIRSGLWQYSDRIKREKGLLYFINIVVGAIGDCPHPVVVTDIRTVEELEAMRSVGAKVILVLKIAAGALDIEPLPCTGIPGARMSYCDLQADGVFFNHEHSNPKLRDDLIETFCKYTGILKEETMEAEGGIAAKTS